MSFVSITFVAFLAGLLLIYWLFPKKLQWIWLLLGSYLFYAWNSPGFTLFLLFSTITTWGFPILIERLKRRGEQYLHSQGGQNLSEAEKKAYRKSSNGKERLLLVACLACNLGMLIFLKYTNFVIGNLATLGISAKPLSWLVLPLGISFYTFQSTSYVVDVYRGTSEPQKNIFRYALFVSFFPAVCQGPISRYDQLTPQLTEEHSFDEQRFTAGIERILLGLIKKIVIASNIGIIVDRIYDDPYLYSGFVVVYATVLYAVQIYADFSGYMDIASGTAQTFGITLVENFQSPYRSRTIAEYWRRWHITMGSWFKDYLYYPILRSNWMKKLSKHLQKAGNKKKAATGTTVLALLITWLATGLWHGANWTFLLWGLWHGLCISLAIVFAGSLEKAGKVLSIRPESKWWKAFQTVRTFAIVCIGYVFFRGESFHKIALVFKQILLEPFIPSAGGSFFFNGSILPMSTPQWIFTMVCAALMLCLDRFQTNQGLFEWLNRKKLVIRWTVLYGMMLILLAGILLSSGMGYDATSFIYNGF